MADINFSTNLFWDVDLENIDIQENRRFIIQRVVEYGIRDDWEIIKKIYGLATIGQEMKQARQLENSSLSFISAVTNIPIKDFRCYKLKQSQPKHWNF